jgi:glycosyltransferase involved in cell wall biosynthesis
MEVKTRPRLGIFTRPIDQGTSGSGHHLLEMVKQLLELNKRFEVFFIHYERSDKEIYRRARQLIIPRNPFQARKLLVPFDFDILHYNPLTVYSPIWGIKAKKVATEHGAEPLLIPRYYSPLAVIHEALVVPYYDRRMDHLIVVSNTTKEFFTRRYGVPESRITVCYNAVNENFRVLKHPDPAVLQKYRIGDKFIFHLSMFSERKNPWTILRGFRHFLDCEGSDGYRLVLAGKGWDNERVSRVAARLGIADRTIRPGYIPQEEAVELLNQAKAFVFPSLAEGFGMPNVEAMACGCPVITSRVFAIPEIVGDAALIMDDPTDSAELAARLQQLVKDERLRAKLIERGLERVGMFSWEASARKLLEVYESLTPQSRKGRSRMSNHAEKG